MKPYSVYETDVLVIGGGITATRAAVAAHDQGARVVLVDKGILGKSGGGPVAYSVTCALMEKPDSAETLFQDMIASGQGLNNRNMVKAFVEDVIEGRVLDLERFGIVFAREKDGQLSRRQMGGHSQPRDVASFHAASMVNVMVSEVLRREIKVFNETAITRLLTDKGRVVGAVGLNRKTGELMVFRAKSTVLTAGGASQVFGPGNVCGYSTTCLEITGDSYAMAYRVGAELIDMEFIQYIVGFAYPELFKGILAGEPAAQNAKLYNSLGERFMERYDPKRMEKSTKDVLAASIVQEVKAGRGTPHGGVWMDFSAASEDSLHIFPYPFEQAGIDPKKDKVEVMPAAHYHMGGVKVNDMCQSGVAGLYASAEAAGGLHGANRLAGCSTADSNVFGARSGKYAALDALRTGRVGIDWQQVHEEEDRFQGLLESARRTTGIKPVDLKRKIQAVLWDDAGPLRDRDSLNAALKKIKQLREEYTQVRLRDSSLQYNNELMEAIDIANMLDFGEIMSQAALLREETRGGHYREDFPNKNDEKWLKNIVIKKEGSNMSISTMPVVL